MLPPPYCPSPCVPATEGALHRITELTANLEMLRAELSESESTANENLEMAEESLAQVDTRALLPVLLPLCHLCCCLCCCLCATSVAACAAASVPPLLLLPVLPHPSLLLPVLSLPAAACPLLLLPTLPPPLSLLVSWSWGVRTHQAALKSENP